MIKPNPDKTPDVIPAAKAVKKRPKCFELLELMKKSTALAPYRLCRPYIGPKESFAVFYWYDRNTNKYIREKVRLGLRGLSDMEIKSQLQIVCTRFNKVLKDRNSKGLYHDQFIRTKKPNGFSHVIPKALQFIRNSEDEYLTEDRKASLRETSTALSNFFEVYPSFSTVRVTDIDDTLLIHFIKWCKAKGRTGKTINKYLSVIQFATEWLARKKLIPASSNTIHLRVPQPKNESGRFPKLTDEEKERVFKYWKAKDPNFHHFLFWMYYTCIRGIEIHRIKREQIDFRAKTVFLSYLDTKNGLSNYVQLLQPLIDLMLELEIDKLPGDYYIFGKNFVASQKLYQGGEYSDVWRRNRSAMQIDEKVQCYGLKGTFNVDYIENNKKKIDWEWLRRHNRHATIQQTQQYISGLTAIFLDEDEAVIIDYN